MQLESCKNALIWILKLFILRIAGMVFEDRIELKHMERLYAG